MKIFFDMDGVLVDFASGVSNAIGTAIDTADMRSKAIRQLVHYEGIDKVLPVTHDYIEAITGIKDAKGERTKWMKLVGRAVFSIVGQGGHSYWSTLPSLPGFHKMIKHAQGLIGVENVYICTAPVVDKTGGCESGKRQWVSDNTTVPVDQVYVTRDKAGVLKDFPGETCILVDDRTKYCDAWNNGGGIAIRHPPPATMATVENTISQINLIVKSENEEYIMHYKEKA